MRKAMPEQSYEFPFSALLRGHTIFSEVLRKGEAHALERKIAPSVLLTARLFPDMFPLTRQVQLGCDTAKRAVARLAAIEPPGYEDNETTFEELQSRITKTSEFIRTNAADALAGPALQEFAPYQAITGVRLSSLVETCKRRRSSVTCSAPNAAWN